jgi:hypothetical protein
MSKVLIIGENRRLANKLRRTWGDSEIELETRSWADWAGSVLQTQGMSAGLTFLDTTAPTAPGVVVMAEAMLQLQAQRQDLRCMLLVRKGDLAGSDVLRSLLQTPGVDFVHQPIDADEVRLRIERLMSTEAHEERLPGSAAPAERRFRVARRRSSDGGTSADDRAALRHLVPSLHDPATGRLDARRVSTLFGLPLAEVARQLRRQEATVHKTPDAPALQSGLALYERIAAALLRLAGSPEGLRIWMNAPNPELADATPMELLKQGEGELIQELLEDVLMGQPS